MMKNMFARRTAPGRAADVKAWVAQRLNLTDADLVTVAELACHEPGCPPVETVITLHGADRKRSTWHIHKPLAEVDQADIIAVLPEI